ncbi:MAG: PAS domain S-box protein [Gemmatimonadota bacterium]|nr:PAS domain S-box protein [Gemmatimonadota bacterium]MDH3428144.1 PAS domain S-box protein [Gemmatimonadota bacterium]
MDYDFEQFFDDSLDLFCIASPDGYFKRLNPSFERILGWSTEQLLSRPFVEFIHPDDVDATVQVVERLGEGIPTVEFDNRYQCQDGSFRYLRWTAHPDPATGLLYAIARDVTESRKARDRFRIALEASPTAILMIGAEGTITLINRAAEKLFGYRSEELRGKKLEVLVPERYRGVHPALRAEFAGNPGSREMGAGRDLTALRKDGSEVPVEIGLSPMETEDETFVLAAVRDRTARLRAAAELKRSNQELEHFARVASHDLQEPLRMVAGYTQLLATRYGGQLDETAREYMRYAVDGTARMQELIQGLLTYSRVQLEAGEPESVDLEEVVEWARANLQTAITESGATLTVGRLPTVDGERLQFGQLFQNLIGNALKFRGEKPPHIEISATRQDGEWLFAVSDNGIGIAEEFREHVFEMFNRLHTVDEYEGTGIGLSVCRRIVERHEGRMWLESVPGEGTTFYFTLPA